MPDSGPSPRINPMHKARTKRRILSSGAHPNSFHPNFKLISSKLWGMGLFGVPIEWIWHAYLFIYLSRSVKYRHTLKLVKLKPNRSKKPESNEKLKGIEKVAMKLRLQCHEQWEIKYELSNIDLERVITRWEMRRTKNTIEDRPNSGREKLWPDLCIARWGCKSHFIFLTN